MPPAAYLAAALQFRVDVGDVPANRGRAVRWITEAAKRGARLLVLPEMWSTGFAEGALLPLSRTTPDILVELRTLAVRHRLVIAGSLPERVGRGVFNTLYVVNATGVVTGEYRKAHLFTPSGEDRWFRRGTSAGTVPSDAGLLGPLICYDLRFPELSRKYFLEGSGVLCVSSQWPAVRSAHWGILTVARAVENQAYLVAANAVGPSGPFRYSGGSVIVSPAGERMAEAGEKEGIAMATIDPAVVDEIRRRIPCLADRNPKAYRATRRPG
ncbi:MAG: carbon-nitrogen family hydrolase [Deltaproteobacteria bacterium]|nr:carbon-nitrogen family hydrolase [Deltaproteobacteria bacterium]